MVRFWIRAWTPSLIFLVIFSTLWHLPWKTHRKIHILRELLYSVREWHHFMSWHVSGPPGSPWWPRVSQCSQRCLPVSPYSQMCRRCPWRDDGAKPIICLKLVLENGSLNKSKKMSKWSPKDTWNWWKHGKHTIWKSIQKHVPKNDEQRWPRNLKNSVFALEGLHFSRFQASSKSSENYTKMSPRISPKSWKMCSEGFRKHS